MNSLLTNFPFRKIGRTRAGNLAGVATFRNSPSNNGGRVSPV